MTDDLAVPAFDRGGRGTQEQVEDIDLGTRAASVLVVGFGCDLHGWAILESTGAAVAKVRLHDGRDANSPVVVPIGLAAGAGSYVYASDLGIGCDTGLFLEVVSGSVEAVVYVKAPPFRGAR